MYETIYLLLFISLQYHAIICSNCNRNVLTIFNFAYYIINRSSFTQNEIYKIIFILEVNKDSNANKIIFT